MARQIKMNHRYACLDMLFELAGSLHQIEWELGLSSKFEQMARFDLIRNET